MIKDYSGIIYWFITFMTVHVSLQVSCRYLDIYQGIFVCDLYICAWLARSIPGQPPAFSSWPTGCQNKDEDYHKY